MKLTFPLLVSLNAQHKSRSAVKERETVWRNKQPASRRILLPGRLATETELRDSFFTFWIKT